MLLTLCTALVAGCASSSSDVLDSTGTTGFEQPTGETGERTNVIAASAPRRAAQTDAIRTEAKTAEGKRAESVRVLLESSTPGSTAYKIGPLDVLDISVFKVPELSKSVQVADTGTVNLPLVGEVVTAGRTAREIEQDLVQRLGNKYLRDPQVTVFVKEYNSQRITVEGAVKKPGVFPYKGRTTLLQSIAMAEGLDAVSDSNVIVFRTTNGKRAAARFDMVSIRSGKTIDPPLESGDVVVVETSTLREVFQNIIKAAPLAGIFALL